jgi:uncharacterized membrane protein
MATKLGYRISLAPEAPGWRTSPSWAAAAPRALDRLDSIDLLRGLVMVVMALDHTRDFFAGGTFNPRDVADPALFLTRWVTHFCAPVFVFLAGIAAFMRGARDGSRGELARFLLTRGLWLVLLELTLVRFAWTFSVYPDFVLLQVIWVIGIAMTALAGLIYLPRWAIATIALVLIGGHNLLDGVDAAQFGELAWLWHVLHQPALLEAGPEVSVFALYAVIPWVGVMAAGYALGPVMLLEPVARRRRLIGLGAAVTLGFVLLRAANLYGDPAPWVAHDSLLASALSFIDAEKYPPSLLYLAMTLGPALLLLAALERARGGLARVLLVFGRVPLFYYLLHILLLHTLAVAFSAATFGDTAWLFGGLPIIARPEGYGLDLGGVYLAWLVVVALLYLPCAWFAGVRRRQSAAWLSYL